MERDKIIPAEEYSSYYNIEVSFLRLLGEHGLISLNRQDENLYIHHDDLSALEKYMHLHYDLQINLEGIEAIAHLLERITNMQEQLTALQNRLGNQGGPDFLNLH